MFRAALGAEGIFTRFEGLESGILVAEVFDADFIEIVAAHIERQVLAPVIGVAFIHDATVHIDAVDHIGARPGRGFQPRFVEPRAGFLVPFFRPRRHAADLFDQAAPGHAGAEIEFNGVIVDHLDLGDQLAHCIGIGFQPLIQQQVVAKGDVMGRHRVTGREFRVFTHVEHHPVLALGVFKALAQQAIGFAVNIRGHDLSADALAKQAFIHHRAQRTATALARIGVHRIKRPEGRD